MSMLRLPRGFELEDSSWKASRLMASARIWRSRRRKRQRDSGITVSPLYQSTCVSLRRRAKPSGRGLVLRPL